MEGDERMNTEQASNLSAIKRRRTEAGFIPLYNLHRYERVKRQYEINDMEVSK